MSCALCKEWGKTCGSCWQWGVTVGWVSCGSWESVLCTPKEGGGAWQGKGVFLPSRLLTSL